MPAATPSLPLVPGLWTEVQGHFGLSQAALGRLLGLRPEMMHQVVTGRCSLPLAAPLVFTRLVLALGPNEAPAAPVPFDAARPGRLTP